MKDENKAKQSYKVEKLRTNSLWITFKPIFT